MLKDYAEPTEKQRDGDYFSVYHRQQKQDERQYDCHRFILWMCCYILYRIRVLDGLKT